MGPQCRMPPALVPRASASPYPQRAMSPSSAGSAALTPERRLEIERWFARRGVPQLIEDYSSEAAMDRRAAPFISLWLIVGTIRDWGTRPDWPLLWNAVGVVATLAWMAVLWVVVSRLRGRPFRERPNRFDLGDIATMALLPALPAAVVHGSAAEAAAAALGALTGIGAIYVIIGFGLVEIAIWAVERLWAQLSHLAALVARTLPLLLILVVFLLFAAEIWEVAHAMSTAELAVMLLLMVVVAFVLVTSTIRGELGRLEQRMIESGDVSDAVDTPCWPLVGEPGVPITVPRLSRLQLSNLALLVAIPQLIQALAVALVVGAFLGLFALIAIPAPVQEAWMGEPGRVLTQFAFIGESRTLSQELLIVSAILGGIVGLYFSGLAISDPAYRSEQFDRDLAEVRQLVAARALYVDALRADASPG